MILKEVKLHSLNLISLGVAGNQRKSLKKINFHKNKDWVKLEATDMRLTRLGKKSFRYLIKFKQKSFCDSKLQTPIFLINDNSLHFNIIFGTVVIHLGALTISVNDVKIN